MANEVSDLSQVTRRLDIIINLLLEMRPEGARKVTMRQKIQELSDMGLSSTEIADIVGWLPKSVSGELSKISKGQEGDRPRQ